MSASDAAGPIPVRKALAAIGRHPVALLVALLVLPLGLLVVEATLLALLIEQAWFDYLVMDLLPISSPIGSCRRSGTTSCRSAVIPFSFYRGVYVDGLTLGYSLAGGVASLAAQGPRLPGHALVPPRVRLALSGGTGPLLGPDSGLRRPASRDPGPVTGLIATVDPRPRTAPGWARS